MKIKLLKPITLNKNYILSGTEMKAHIIGDDVVVEYSTCCSVGTRKLESDEYQVLEKDDLTT